MLAKAGRFTYNKGSLWRLPSDIVRISFPNVRDLTDQGEQFVQNSFSVLIFLSAGANDGYKQEIMPGPKLEQSDFMYTSLYIFSHPQNKAICLKLLCMCAGQLTTA